MIRRQFLKFNIRGISALAAIPSITLGRLGRIAANDKITVAFIGTGNNGTNWLRHFFRDDRVRVVAVCDVNREGPGYWDGTIRGREPARKMVNENYGDNSCASYEDYRDVLARNDIDAVYISTPDHWHAIMAIEAANAGKDIYCQKPLALTVQQGRAMVDTVKRTGVVFQTGSQQRSDFNFRRVCELALNGYIGELQTVRCGLPGGTPDFGRTAHKTEITDVPDGFNYNMWLGPAPFTPYCPARVGVNFRWNLDYSGGQLTDWGGHHPDIAQWGMGTQYTGPVRIQNASAQYADHPVYNTAIHYHFECLYKNGTKLIIGDDQPWGVTFEGSEGRLWAKRGEHTATPASLLATELASEDIRLYKSNDHVTNFIDCMITRKEPVAPVEVAHRSITIAHLGNIAMRLGHDLEWDPDRELFVSDNEANRMLSRSMRSPWHL